MNFFGYRQILKGKATLFLLLLFSIHTLHAAWVDDIPTTVKNPDGTVIECFASGDEFFNFLHDSDGFTIIAGEDGFHYYAIPSGDTLAASTLRVGEADPKQAGLTLRAGISEKEYQRRKDKMLEIFEDNPIKAAHTGILNNLVVYIRFSDDTEFTTPRSTFDGRLNNDQAPSVKNYFQEVSYGMVTVESHHYPPSAMNVNISYQDVYPRSYFEPYHAVNNPNGYTSAQRTSREHQLLHRAVNAIAEHVPQDLELDNDGDGRVDNVCFIIKGGSGPWASILWAHRWALFSTNTFINGKRVWDYTFQPETQATVQILNHELFHTFGAPDLYRYSNSNITPVGPWDLMHSGHGHMGAYMKWKYSNQTWISDIPVISTPGTYTLNPLTSPENNAFRINSPNSETEYFVVEYRKKEPGTYENNLPGSGLLIYRINTLAGNGNANGPPDEVYVYRPNGTNNLNGIVFSANYSAQVDRTEISNSTNPSPFLSDDSAGGLIISNIGSAGSTISFDLFGGPTDSFEITTAASPLHGGTVAGAGTWYEGHTATLTANAANGFSFENWTENGTVVSSQSNYSFTVSADRHLVANFGSAAPVWHISLTANPTAGGSVNGAGNHTEGENITVIATSSTGYNFISWTENGSVVSTSASYSFVVEENRDLTANFAIKTYQITLTANPTNGGNLTGAGTVNHGTVRAVNAFPASGFTFENWTENGVVVSSNTQYIFQTTSDRNLVANFSSNSTPVYSVVLNSSPTQGGTTTGAGNYNDGQQATLTATPSAGYQFANWTENGTVVSSQASYSFTVTNNRTLTANFALTSHSISLNANPSTGGSVSGGGSYYHGQTAVVSATPSAGYTFVNWTENGNAVSTNSSYSFAVTGNRSLTAHFSLNTYTITVNTLPSSGGAVSGGGSYDHG
ncbi:MAG: M6 family metalloprotease domain-containing protein, partial [Bacteroidetes bacterium]